jgi:hypothetical protein
LGLGGVLDVEADGGPSGWVRRVTVRTSSGSRSLPATEFANRLGLRSQSFRIGVLRLEASTGSTVFGQRVLLHGLARGLHGSLEFRRPGGSWHGAPLSRAWLFVRPTRTTEYRLAALGVATAPTTVDVAPALRVTRRARRLTGLVRPGIPRLQLTIQRLLAGNWLTIRTARLDGAGGFRLDRGLPAGIYRARTAATSALVAAASPPIRVP